jgi:predicted hotdog family 3-hydroxylacyl-ACP dehydratase
MGDDLAWVIERLPHRPPMRLIDEVVEASGRRLVARATIHDDHILLVDGHVTPLLAIELFAQAAAALLVWLGGKGAPPAVSGYLLGTRKLDMDPSGFTVGDTLDVIVEETWSTPGLAQLAGELRKDGASVATGSVTVGSA